MKELFKLLVTLLALLLIVTLLAAAYLGAAVGLGWALSHLVALDLFHATLLALIAVGAAAVVVFLVLRAINSPELPADVDDDYGIDEDDDSLQPPKARSEGEPLPPARVRSLADGFAVFMGENQPRLHDVGRVPKGKRKGRTRH